VPARVKTLNVSLREPEISVADNNRELDIGSRLRPRNQGD
jgi:hypothetical protein